MCGIYFVLAATLALAVATPGPDSPVLPSSECFDGGEFFADSSSMCWYHECLSDGNNGYYLLPRPCALGSMVDYNFVTSKSNPCTVNVDSNIGYECERGSSPVDVPPTCATDGSLTCYNGGTPTYEAGNCWCLCPEQWSGDFDCSKPPGFYGDLAPGSNICATGEPDQDNCYLNNGCENGGTCYNLCRGFWCECPNRESIDHVGARCETSYRIADSDRESGSSGFISSGSLTHPNSDRRDSHSRRSDSSSQ